MMSDIDDTIKELLDRPIAFNPVFARIGGSTAAGVMLSQLWYWTPRTKARADDWIYKSGEEWEQEAGLSRAELESARKILVSRGLLEAEKRGVPCRYYYRIKQDAILKAIKGESAPPPHKGSENLKHGRSGTSHSSLPETGKLISSENDLPESAPAQFAGNRQTRMSETGKLDCRGAADKNVGNRQTSLPVSGKHSNTTTETTAEITTQTTTTMRATPRPAAKRESVVVDSVIEKNADTALTLTPASNTLASMSSITASMVGNVALNTDLSPAPDRAPAPEPLRLVEGPVSAAARERDGKEWVDARRALLADVGVKGTKQAEIAQKYPAKTIRQKIAIWQAKNAGKDDEDKLGAGWLVTSFDNAYSFADVEKDEARRAREAEDTARLRRREQAAKQAEKQESDALMAAYDALPAVEQEDVDKEALSLYRGDKNSALCQVCLPSARLTVMRRRLAAAKENENEKGEKE